MAAVGASSCRVAEYPIPTDEELKEFPLCARNLPFFACFTDPILAAQALANRDISGAADILSGNAGVRENASKIRRLCYRGLLNPSITPEEQARLRRWCFRAAQAELRHGKLKID